MMTARPFSFLLLLGVSAGAQERELGRDVNFYSKEKEAALGAGLARDMRQRTTPVDNAAIGDYVSRVGRQLSAQLPGTDVAWSFTVVIDGLGGRTREPASLPGGYIFVPVALMLAAQDEAEFAGMLAHAMAHTAERHGMRRGTRGQTADPAQIPLIYVGGWSGFGGDEDGGAVPLGFLQFQRRFELEADQLAARTMARAGYDPSALARYIGRLQPENAGPSKAISRLPSRSVRLAGLDQAIRELPYATYSLTSDFQSIQEEARRAVGTNPVP